MSEVFHVGSTTHLLTLLICGLLGAAITWKGKALAANAQRQLALRHAIALGCLAAWVLNTGFWLVPSRFSWDQALPLQFCNLANLVSALALWKKPRWAQSLLYFWALGLSTWAFLTPSLAAGPALVEFWIFWIYHIFILFAVLWCLVIDRFRPTWRDFRLSLAITLGYLAILFILDRITGWNYGFAGEAKPLQPSPIDGLGPYPIRVLWLALIGTAVFALLMLPFSRKEKADS
ncbi:MAG: TIGR02206 family membrane protein [Verrucomicrobiales bacterium]|nr:TIGR02206 family membrane protein [Verrucomicrobiales bacterium]